MQHELIDRYIYAVTRHLPPKIRADVKQELESLIFDMLEARCGDILPTERDIRVVLTELGTPEELASKYSGEDRQSLISGVYFIAYRRVLRIVLPIVVAAVTLSVLLSTLLDKPADTPYFFLILFGQTVGSALAAGFQAFAIVTFIFAVLERFDAPLGADYLSYLPPAPQQARRIKPYEPIIGILLSLFAVIVFLGFPQMLSVYIQDGGWITIFNVTVLRQLWLPIILWAVLGIAKEAMKLIEGRNTIRLVVVSIAANILIVIGTYIVFIRNNVLNPVLVDLLSKLPVGQASEFLELIGSSLSIIIFAAVTLALLIESITLIAQIVRSSRL
ncbi:MAG: hypothetical protein FWD45_01015 [Coriobacteriia bacterium]|nr:hypothetical protein [Coriobacteriia bacterium]